jgi:hypothetical protein
MTVAGELTDATYKQVIAEPHIFRFLSLTSSVRCLERMHALCGDSEKHVRKISMWTRKIALTVEHEGLQSSPEDLVVLRLGSLAASIIVHARRVLELDLYWIIATDDILDTITGAASSLTSLRLTLGTPSPSVAALTSLGTLVNLRTLDLTVHWSNDALHWASSSEWAGWDFEHLNDLTIDAESSFPSDCVALVRFLSRCRLPSLSVLDMAPSSLSLQESQVFVDFFREHTSIRRCELTDSCDAALVIPHLASTHLRLQYQLQDLPLTPLHSRVRTLSFAYGFRLGTTAENAFFRALDAFHAQDRARNGLAYLHLSLNLRWAYYPIIFSRFQWFDPGEGIVEFVERMRPYALQLRGQGIEVLDSNGLTVEGLQIDADGAA